MTIIKRKKESSTLDLIDAIKKFNLLLTDQDENDAAEALQQSADKLAKAAVHSPEYKEAISNIIEAFEEHELNAYMIHREDSSQWTVAEELAHASCRVMSLVKRSHQAESE